MTGVEGRRVGGGAAIVGGVLALVGNLLHPRYGDEPDFDVYRKIAVSDRYVVSDFLLIAALIIVTAGFVAIARDSGYGSWSGYGRLAALVGGGIAVSQIGLEMFAFKHQTEVFARATPEDLNGSFWAANAIDHVNTALFNTWTLVFLGIAPILIAVAALQSRRASSWVSALALLGGAICALVGIVNLGRDDQTTLEIPFLVGSLLITAWVLASGWFLVRRDALGSDSAVGALPARNV
jgi:hypothetical protein